VRGCRAARFDELGWYANWSRRSVEPTQGLDTSESDPQAEARREGNEEWNNNFRKRPIRIFGAERL